jgi:hypothetical protein
MAPKRRKSSWKRNFSLILVGTLLIAIIFVMFNPPQEAQRPQPTALIYDPLVDNPASTGFTEACSGLLVKAGFRVEIVSGRSTTVESIRNPRQVALIIQGPQLRLQRRRLVLHG